MAGLLPLTEFESTPVKVVLTIRDRPIPIAFFLFVLHSRSAMKCPPLLQYNEKGAVPISISF